jgi:hypothetical protein
MVTKDDELHNEINKLKEELLIKNIILARLDHAISTARGVALTRELSAAYIALEDIHPIGWLADQGKISHIKGMQEAIELIKSQGENDELISVIENRINDINKNYYWVVNF